MHVITFKLINCRIVSHSIFAINTRQVNTFCAKMTHSNGMRIRFECIIISFLEAQRICATALYRTCGKLNPKTIMTFYPFPCTRHTHIPWIRMLRMPYSVVYTGPGILKMVLVMCGDRNFHEWIVSVNRISKWKRTAHIPSLLSCHNLLVKLNFIRRNVTSICHEWKSCFLYGLPSVPTSIIRAKYSWTYRSANKIQVLPNHLLFK